MWSNGILALVPEIYSVSEWRPRIHFKRYRPNNHRGCSVCRCFSFGLFQLLSVCQIPYWRSIAPFKRYNCCPWLFLTLCSVIILTRISADILILWNDVGNMVPQICWWENVWELQGSVDIVNLSLITYHRLVNLNVWQLDICDAPYCCLLLILHAAPFGFRIHALLGQLLGLLLR